MIFILTALPHYLIHLLTFKRIIITPIMLVLSILAFGMILGCLFASISSNPELSSSYGIYKFSFDSSSFTNKIKPTALGIVTLICVVATLIVSCIPARKKVSK
jgi:uncharacterized membrane protein YjgN (DUF898 family)